MELPNVVEDEATYGYQRMRPFIKKHMGTLVKFGRVVGMQESERFLMEHPYLACGDSVHFYVGFCLSLTLEEHYDLMENVAHQRGLILFLTRLAKRQGRDTKCCIPVLFSRLLKDSEYGKVFNEELNKFKKKIRKLAKKELAEFEEDVKFEEELERRARLGPGGLDPLDVVGNLPRELRGIFKSRDLNGVREILGGLPDKEAIKHLEACIGSGLWIAADETEGQQIAETTQQKLHRLMCGNFTTGGIININNYEFPDTDESESESEAEAEDEDKDESMDELMEESEVEEIEELVMGADAYDQVEEVEL